MSSGHIGIPSPTTLGELAKALAAAQLEMRAPALDSVNPHFRSRYASLAAVREAIVPVLARHGIATVQRLMTGDRSVSCETMLLHASGQHLSATLALPVAKADAQAYGSAASYARRYGLLAIVGIAADDDDGAGAGAAPASKPAAEDTVGEAELAQLKELAESTDSDMQKLLGWLRLGSMQDMTRAQYKTALAALKNKADKQS